MSDKYTPAQMRKDLLSDAEFPPARVQWLISGYTTLEHAAQAAELLKSAETIRSKMAGTVTPHDYPLHRELDEAMAEAARTAEEAFEAALSAAWKFYHVSTSCTCPECRLRGQRSNASLQ